MWYKLGLRTGIQYIYRENRFLLGSIEMSYRRSVYRSKYRKENILTLWWLSGYVPAKTERVIIFELQHKKHPNSNWEVCVPCVCVCGGGGGGGGGTSGVGVGVGGGGGGWGGGGVTPRFSIE